MENYKNPFTPDEIPATGDVAEWTAYASWADQPTTSASWDALVEVAPKVAAKCRARFDDLLAGGAPRGRYGYGIPGVESSYGFLPDDREAYREFTDLEDGLNSQAFQKAWEQAWSDALEAEIRGWEEAEARVRAWVEAHEPEPPADDEEDDVAELAADWEAMEREDRQG